MSFTPSLPLKHVFKRASDVSKNQDDTQTVVAADYYKKIRVAKDVTAPNIVRKNKDITNNDFHFFFNQRSKILEGKGLEIPATEPETIVINHNADLSQNHPQRVLERLLKQLKSDYGIDEKNVVYGKEGTFIEYPNGRVILIKGNDNEVTFLVKNYIKDENENIIDYELEESELGNAIIDIYLNNPNYGIDGDCCVASFHRFEKAFESKKGNSLTQYLNNTNYKNGRSNFRAIWYTSYKDFDWRKIDKQYAGKGGAGAIESANLGRTITTSEIFEGKLKPGAVVQYWNEIWHYERLSQGNWNLFTGTYGNKPSGHSFIFLGYIFDEQGNITGMYQWNYSNGGFAEVKRSTAPIFFGTNYEN